MDVIITFLDFAINILCMIPSINEIEVFSITQDQAVLFLFGSISLFILSITTSALKEFLKNTILALIAAFCILSIGFIGIIQEPKMIEMIKQIIFSSYPAMVITLRLVEGIIVGEKTSPHLHWWHFILYLLIIIGLFYLPKLIPTVSLTMIKGTWAILGAGLSAYIGTRMLKNAIFSPSILTIISTFFIFTSTIIFVTVSPLLYLLYKWILPVGLVMGIIFGRKTTYKS